MLETSPNITPRENPPEVTSAECSSILKAKIWKLALNRTFNPILLRWRGSDPNRPMWGLLPGIFWRGNVFRGISGYLYSLLMDPQAHDISTVRTISAFGVHSSQDIKNRCVRRSFDRLTVCDVDKFNRPLYALHPVCPSICLSGRNLHLPMTCSRTPWEEGCLCHTDQFCGCKSKGTDTSYRFWDKIYAITSAWKAVQDRAQYLFCQITWIIWIFCQNNHNNLFHYCMYAVILNSCLNFLMQTVFERPRYSINTL